jgi:hypothetical protein
MKTILLLWFSTFYSAYTTSQFVDDVEPLLRANRDAYLGGPHTVSRRNAALAYFDQQWSWLRSSQACGSNLLKTAGKLCLSDRSRTGQWPWEVYYRDPIVVENVAFAGGETATDLKQ